jgi:uncharacterized protein (DUF2141 family)
MKWIASVLSLIVSLVVGTSAHGTSSETAGFGDLEIVAVGFKSGDGKVQIALYQAEEGRPFEGGPFRQASVAIEKRKSTWVFERIPFGEYGVKIYHDENGNGELDTNFLGVPKEAYGFSNNARGTFGPPKDEKIKFSLRDARMRMEIMVK